MNGKPLPILPNLIGEEIPLDQLIDHLFHEQQVLELVDENEILVDVDMLQGQEDEAPLQG
jgi:hypothetical protein